MGKPDLAVHRAQHRVGKHSQLVSLVIQMFLWVEPPRVGTTAKGWNRRVLPVAARAGEGLLTEPRAGAQPERRELVFLPPKPTPAGLRVSSSA
jgi:hypothetical protein